MRHSVTELKSRSRRNPPLDSCRHRKSRIARTYPFPDGLTPDLPASRYASDDRAVRIADAARRLNELRENWLNPTDLVKRELEVVADYPDRILPIDDNAARTIRRRTLTTLYNQRPTWLDNAHRDLDTAVAAAYGWPKAITEEEALAKLFALNQRRAGTGNPTPQEESEDEEPEEA